ncbi:MAG: hypothetical protein IMW91_08840 [Firmicutes bacterium]|nr:hypothetical protein [Bacillota bacterium]
MSDTAARRHAFTSALPPSEASTVVTSAYDDLLDYGERRVGGGDQQLDSMHLSKAPGVL